MWKFEADMLTNSNAFGSNPAGPSVRTQVTFARTTRHNEILKDRSDALEGLFRAGGFSCPDGWMPSFRPLHTALFHGLCPQLPSAIGTFRGTPGSKIQRAEREVRIPNPSHGVRPKDPCVKPNAVIPQMTQLEKDIQSSLPFLGTDKDAIQALADFTFRFFHIHPFLDGNGHVWRVMALFLARRFDIEFGASWSVHARPYDADFSAALQCYPYNSTHLENKLASFIG